ncbi:DUF4265 domain-containing protein [Geomonas propionica]|uniref:DUF4265 domain-containing protein n=1 Tax=Geomonas propionica TaxID=2798582 RepID=A0ABS0YT23_9BACT|nr:DUF4265 domain-containing protein [Geomonas propionica]MBJ6801134.1 DUF4265 domain-containing protein [Geomonas propionica]
MSDAEQLNAKVLFRVFNDDGTAEVETLWATKLDGDNYRLENSPFYAYGVSWQDIIFAPFDQDEGFPSFQSVVTKSGHRTVRVVFQSPVEDGNNTQQILQTLVDLGCTYEGANNSYVAVDVPPTSDFEAVCNFLTERAATWEHADPTYSSLYPSHT